jgi:hypothetical protein
MILIFHIFVAISSLIWTGYVYYSPSKLKLNTAYVLTALMLISGFSLILTKPGQMTQTCLEGLTFLALVGYGLVKAKNKLAVINR